MTQEQLLAHFRATLAASYEAGGRTWGRGSSGHRRPRCLPGGGCQVRRESAGGVEAVTAEHGTAYEVYEGHAASCAGTLSRYLDLRAPAAAAIGEFEATGTEEARAKVNVLVGPVNAALDEEQADCDKVDPGDAVNGVVERIEGVRAARAHLRGLEPTVRQAGVSIQPTCLDGGWLWSPQSR